MNVVNAAKFFGCHDVVPLGGKPNPRQLYYLDLLKDSEQGQPKVDAVAEFQSRPLLYILSSDRLRDLSEEKRLDLQCMLANRGERAFLGVLSPGELNVYPINLDRGSLTGISGITIQRESPEAPLFFQSVADGVFQMEGLPEASDFVFKTIIDLMTNSSDILIGKYGLNPLDVLSFLGRALFFRFLWDRGIVRADDLDSVCPGARSPGDCFLDSRNAIETCRWLDETFNGDMLPFSDDYAVVFKKAAVQTSGSLFRHLQAILRGWKHAGRESFQMQIDWGDLDFAHIPIGVFSQVYENFSKIWDSRLREQTSIYYTPKNIARYLVDDAFEGVAEKKDARILDPSCGAGIFLVMAFRKIVAARWELDGKRPGTKAIQSILYNQLCGFDISESALRLAALSLYITAIELNGSPRPPKSLKFPKPLQDIVLHNHRRPEEQKARGFVMGSLRPDLSGNFEGSFDLVIGNPPWGRLRGKNEKGRKEVKEQSAELTRLTREILKDRGLLDIAPAYANPDNNPDLPFLWRSIQWAKPGGIVALVLPGRIFLKQTDAGTRAFHAILRGVEITGILNGSNLSDSEVWPGMSQPFMLFFARNRIPDANHHFYFATPHFEPLLNHRGRLRIDYQSAQPVSASETEKDSRLLKILALGTALDVEVIRKLDRSHWHSVQSFWKNYGLYSGLGYNMSPELKQSDASFMYNLPDFSKPPTGSFSVAPASLGKFKSLTAHMPRRMELYTSPLLIVPQSPNASPTSAKSYLFRENVVFSQSYYGFSVSGLSAIWPVALLHLITHSELFRYYVLMTCSRIGAERRTMTKSDIENFPFPSIDVLTDQQKQYVVKLSSKLEIESEKPWDAIDGFIYDLYGLDDCDRQVAKDTLETAEPFRKSRDRANAPPGRDERNTFYSELERLLAPSFAISNEAVTVEEFRIMERNIRSSWHFFTITSSIPESNMAQSEQQKLLLQIAEEANKTGCSRVIVNETGRLLVGIIGQYRYWTPTRARLCALDILRNYLDAFPVRKS